MRNILPILAVVLAAAAPALHAAAPATAWSLSTYSSSGASLAPGSGTVARSLIGAPAALDAAGNLHVVASDGGGCLVTLKYAANGDIAWRQSSCGTNATFGGAIALDGLGDVLVTGTSAGRIVTIKYAGTSGALVWEQRVAEPTSAGGYAIAVDGAGDARVLAMVRGGTTGLLVIRHRAADGAIAWQRVLDSGRDDAAAGFALDAAGNAVVAFTTRNARGDEDFWIVKLDDAGTVAWESRYDSGLMDVAAAVAFDAAGNVLATGVSDAGAEGNVMRTVKLAAADGSALWERRFGGGISGGTAVRADARGNVIVAGYATNRAGDMDIATVKYAADGTPMWQAAFAGTTPGMEFARSLALDAAGNVVVTGASHTADAGPEIRTIKYAAPDGAELWSAAHRGGAPGGEDSGHIVLAAADGTYVVGSSTESGRPESLRAIRYRDPAAATPTAFPPGANVQGLWWRPSEPGWGINLTQQGDILFATWFTYGPDGRALWLVMSHGERVGRDAWQGTLYEMRGPAFGSAAFDPSRTAATAVGQASFVFGDADRGQFHFTVNGVSRSKDISRHVFATPAPTCEMGGSAASPPNYQDMWWASPAGSEAGWGLNVAHQGDTLFITWFTYGADGDGMWLVGSSMRVSGPGSYSGALYRTAAAPLAAEPWDAAAFTVAPAGSATLAFDDADNGVFSYVVDGVSQSKRITRQVYATPKTVCR